MNTKTTLSITEARKRIFELAEKLQTSTSHFTLTAKGRPKIVLISAERYESLLETIEVLDEIPDLKARSEEARRDYESGKYKTYTTLERAHGKIWIHTI